MSASALIKLGLGDKTDLLLLGNGVTGPTGASQYLLLGQMGTATQLEMLGLSTLAPTMGYVTLGTTNEIARYLELGLFPHPGVPDGGYILLGTGASVTRLLLLGMGATGPIFSPGTGTLVFNPTGAARRNIMDKGGEDQAYLTYSVTSAGIVRHFGSASAALTFNVTSNTRLSHVGSGTAQLTFQAQGAGKTPISGSGFTAQVQFNAVGLGTKDQNSQTSAALLQFVTTSSGLPKQPGPFGSAPNIPLTFSASALGFQSTPPKGTSQATITFVSTGAGRSSRAATGAASLTFVCTGNGRINHYGSGAAILRFIASNHIAHPFMHRRRHF